RCGQLFAALEAADGDADVRVIVIREAGSCVSSGYDPAGTRPLPFHTPGARGAGARAGVRGRFPLLGLAQPVRAQVHGWCLAGGSELGVACDLVYVAEDAQIAYPAVRRPTISTTHGSWACVPRWSRCSPAIAISGGVTQALSARDERFGDYR